MGRIVITNSSDFELKIQELEDSLFRVKEIFANEKKNVQKINRTDIWTGKVQEIMYNKNIELQKNYSPIEQSLQLYIDFLKKTLSDYRALEAKVDQNAEENATDLDVNS